MWHVDEAIIVGLPFAVLLGLEWRYRLRSVRVGAALLAVALLLFFQPNIHAAWRWAMQTPPANRETHYPSAIPGETGRPLSEFESGVFAMRRAVVEESGGYVGTRWIAVGVLFWLACSPAFRRGRDTRGESAGSASAAPEA